MSDALKKIKCSLSDIRNQRGMRDKVLIDARALYELIDNFEDMDAVFRVNHASNGDDNIRNVLRYAIEAVYRQQGRSSEMTLMIIMDTLRPLMEERAKILTSDPYIRGFRR